MTPAEEAVLAAARAYRDAHARCLAVGLDPPDGIDMDAAGDALLTAATSLRDSLVAANAHAAKLEREAHKDRASIVAFLAAEAKRFDLAAYDFDKMDKADSADRCRTKAGHTRTLAAQIARSDDCLGGVK